MFKENNARKVNIIIILLIAVMCIGVAVKELFVGFSADEEYQLVLSYRLAHGDRLFAEVWDTLQTSAFYGQLLLWIYMKIFHTTTGSLLFLRLFGLLTQAGVSVFLYRTVKRHIKSLYALLISATFFCTFTKLVAMPDFANLQTWSLVVMLCCLWRAGDAYADSNNKKANAYIILAALMYCVAVLSAACVILIPIIAVMLAKLQKGGGVKRNLLFFGTCAVTGVIYMGTVIGVNGFEQTITGIKGIVSGDSTHLSGALLNGGAKYIEYIKECAKIGALLAVTFLIAAALSFAVKRIRHESNNLWMYIWIAEGCLLSLYNWFIKKTGYEGLKLFIPILLIIGVISYIKMKDREMFVPFCGILISIGVFVNVLFISNVSVECNITFLNTAVIWGLVLATAQLKNAEFKRITVLLSAFFVIISSGTMLTVNAGLVERTIFDLQDSGFITEGPAKGAVTLKDKADFYNINTRLFSEMVKEKSSVLIVSNFFYNRTLSSLYMVNDVNISHYTVNSTPTYGNKLYEYWAEFPEKNPEVVVINRDSCFDYDYMWTLNLLYHEEEWVTDSLNSVDYYVLPDHVNEDWKKNNIAE